MYAGVFVVVRCAPSLNPPLEPDAAQRLAESSRASEQGVRNYLICQGAEMGCGGFQRGKGTL